MTLPHGQPHQMPVSPAAPMCPVRTEHRHRHAAHCFAEPWQSWAGTLQYTELCTTHLTDPRFWNLAIIPSAMRDLIILAASTAGMLRLWPSPSRLLDPAHLHSLTCQKEDNQYCDRIRGTAFNQLVQARVSHLHIRKTTQNCHPHSHL